MNKGLADVGQNSSSNQDDAMKRGPPSGDISGNYIFINECIFGGSQSIASCRGLDNTCLKDTYTPVI
jgi:hypothetical protein